jgi:flagella basal body P-ring formation protein FlgA
MVTGLCLGGQSYSTPLQDISVIEHAAYVYALEQGQARYGNPQVVVGNLDSRLRLQQCSRELTAFNNSQKFDLGNQTIGVKCDSETPWTVYVPVTIKLFKPIVVSTRPLQANQIINENDITVRDVDVSTIRYAYFQQPKKLIGQQLKYPMAKGAVVTSQSVQPQKLIKRGELITLMAETQGMQVKMSGTALSDGVLGQKIKVKNSSSERVVEGTVDGHGVVRVMM